MNMQQAVALQADLTEIVAAHAVSVSVGLFHSKPNGIWGVTVTSHCDDVITSNSGPVVSQ